jgi:hypothetical protein
MPPAEMHPPPRLATRLRCRSVPKLALAVSLRQLGFETIEIEEAEFDQMRMGP